jgi:hypothetical protein
MESYTRCAHRTGSSQMTRLVTAAAPNGLPRAAHFSSEKYYG